MAKAKTGGFLHGMMADYGKSDRTRKYPVSLGFTETSAEVVIDVLDLKHVLISGMSQSGKSTMVRRLLPDLIKHADVAIYSTKDSDFVDYEDTAYACSNVEEMGALIRRLVGEVERRNDRLRDARREDGMDTVFDEHPIIVLIDEFQSFMELSDDASRLALTRLIREGAGLHVFLYIITQTPSKKILSDGLRDNITTDIAYRQRDSYTARMALGTREPEFLELHQCIVRNVDKKFRITKTKR